MKASLRMVLHCLLIVEAITVASCTGSGGSPNQATLAAQISRSQQLATRMAVGMQSTSQSAEKQVIATAQAFQALVEATEHWDDLITLGFHQDSSVWLTGEESNEYGSSQWSIENGKFIWEASAEQGMVWWTIPDMQPVGDFYTSVQINRIEAPSDSLVGLAFRVTEDEKGYYLFQVTPFGEYAVYQLANDQWMRLVSESTSPAFEPGQPNQLAVLGQNNSYFFFINGSLAAQMQHDSLANGSIGLAIGLNNANEEGKWEFENFQVKVPSGSQSLPTTSP